jgi:hypothetical protein
MRVLCFAFYPNGSVQQKCQKNCKACEMPEMKISGTDRQIWPLLMKKRIATEMTAIINTVSITVVIVIFAPKLPQLSH